jgi:hypothetical protein
MTLSTVRVEAASLLSRRFARCILFVVVLYELKETSEKALCVRLNVEGV